jgi:uncharacterized protein (TIGR02246 family)
MKPCLLIVLGLALLSPAMAEEIRPMPATPAEVDTFFGKYWNAGDLDGLISLYEADAVLVGQDGTFAAGHEAIRASLEHSGLGQLTIEMNVVQTAGIGEDLAVLFNHWIIRGTGEDGIPFEIPGKAMEVVRRQPDGTWRFAFDHPFVGAPPEPSAD